MPNTTPAGAPHVAGSVSSSNSFVSATALDHLYENYRGNVAAADLKSRANARRPCMVLREYNESYYAPGSTTSSAFLPAEYRMFSEDDVAEMAGDALLGRITLAGPSIGTRRGITSASASDASQRTLSTTVPFGPKAAAATSMTGTERHASSSGFQLSATELLGLGSDEADTEGEDEATAGQATTATIASPPRERRRKASRSTNDGTSTGAVAASTARATAVPPTNGTKNASVPSPPSPPPTSSSAARRTGSLASWSSSDAASDEDVRLRVRCVVPPPPPSMRGGADGRQGPSGGGGGGAAAAAAEGGGGVAAGPAEVEVVRLNAEYYTASELARWHQYQISRLDSFIAPGGGPPRTLSQSAQSRDAPSSNSASGLEFVPLMRGSGSRSLTNDERERENARVAVELGMQPAPTHLVRVLYPGALPNDDGPCSPCPSTSSSLTNDLGVAPANGEGDDAHLETMSAVESGGSSNSRSHSTSSDSRSAPDSFDSDLVSVSEHRSGSGSGRGWRGRTPQTRSLGRSSAVGTAGDVVHRLRREEAEHPQSLRRLSTSQQRARP